MPIVARDSRTTGRIDWRTERDRTDLAAVTTRLLGPATGRRGQSGRRLWWRCPFHEDRNPSFCVEPGKPWWRCYGCGEHGDAVTLAMKKMGLAFPEALDWLCDRQSAPRNGTAGKPPPRPPKRSSPSTGRTPAPAAPPPPETKPAAPGRMLTSERAAALVASAAARLWTPEGADALAYLVNRGLTHETIRAARLGVTPPVADLNGRPAGIVVPWFDGDRLALVKIRQPEGVKPKYREAYRDRPEMFPGPATIRNGRPLVIVEGEFDALLLGQALGDRAAVVTLGSASVGPDMTIRGRLMAVTKWFIAHDADDAGDKAAAHWEAYGRARRVRPPGSFNDWTDAANGDMNLSRWWDDVLNGNPAPPLFTWEELSVWRWGPALTAEPGTDDDYATVERPAIQEANEPDPAP